MIFINKSDNILSGVSQYDFVAILHKADLAWEYLRRNSAYQRAWRQSVPGRISPVKLRDGTLLYRPRRRHGQAEEWGLICFR